MRACENAGRTSAPCLPQALQVKLGSMSDSLTVIGPAIGADGDVVGAVVVAALDQHGVDTGLAQFAETDFPGVVRHGGPSR